jgi:DNA repair photolyase
MRSPNRHQPQTGRGASSNPIGRFEAIATEAVDDGWESLDQPLPAFETIVKPEFARGIISRNKSPDVGFSQSINPYQGCEHGCIYCYARPSHAYLNLSPGLDFETRLFYKKDAARLLEEALNAANYRCEVVALGANTDPYQPIERQYRVTREILEVLLKYRHPVAIITKGNLIERDLDILSELARHQLVSVNVSVTTLNADLKRTLEPRAASPQARLRVIRKLTDAGVPAGVLVAPVIPVLTDHELEAILEACAAAGAIRAGYVLLRLPYELKQLFEEWLQTHEPLKAQHVLSRLRDMRDGKANDPRFGHRMRGEGVLAQLLEKRFAAATAKFGLNIKERTLNTQLFQPAAKNGPQLQLDL